MSKKNNKKDVYWGIIYFMEKTRSQDNQKKVEKVKKVKMPFFKKIAVRIIWIVILVLLFAGASYYTIKKITKVESETKHSLVERQLSFCQELVTTKYRYSDIVTLKKSSGFAKSYSIIKYSGLMRVGIADFTDISYNLSIDGKTIKVKLPKAEILGNELVSQSVFDEKQSVFIPISTQEIFDEIDSARREYEDEMIAEGILDQARLYASNIITQFLLSAGFEKVIIEDL